MHSRLFPDKSCSRKRNAVWTPGRGREGGAWLGAGHPSAALSFPSALLGRCAQRWDCAATIKKELGTKPALEKPLSAHRRRNSVSRDGGKSLRGARQGWAATRQPPDVAEMTVDPSTAPPAAGRKGTFSGMKAPWPRWITGRDLLGRLVENGGRAVSGEAKGPDFPVTTERVLDSLLGLCQLQKRRARRHGRQLCGLG